MNRKTLTAILLAVSILCNGVLFVFAYIQKVSGDATRTEAAALMKRLVMAEQQAKAELDQCEGLRAQSDGAREECEKKILAISNRKQK